MPITVIDLNVLQRDEGSVRRCLAERHRFVLPSEAIFELIKGADWRYALRRSLSALATRPSRVNASLSLGDALLWERDNRDSIASRILNTGVTSILRQILDAIHAEAPELPVDGKGVEEFRTYLKDRLLNDSKNKTDLLTLVNLAGQECFPPEFAARLRRGQVGDDERLEKIKEEAEALLISRYTGFGYTAGTMRSFIRRTPLALRWGYLRLWYACDWIAQGGIESLKQSSATNEAFDSRYVVIASFFDGLMSTDAKMQRALIDLRAMID